MRTAVVRVAVDPAGRLTPDQLVDGMTALRGLVDPADIEVLESNIAAMPASRREVQMLMVGGDAEQLKRDAVALCAKAFGTDPAPGVLTYVSRGTDDDAYGVLAGFGLVGEITRTQGDDGLDVVAVTLRKADLDRVPESRIHTALEASLNCEVQIRTNLASRKRSSGVQEFQDRGRRLHPGVEHVEALDLSLSTRLAGALPGVLWPWRVDQLGALDQAADFQ